jgi:hypothetical protein
LQIIHLVLLQNLFRAKSPNTAIDANFGGKGDDGPVEEPASALTVSGVPISSDLRVPAALFRVGDAEDGPFLVALRQPLRGRPFDSSASIGRIMGTSQLTQDMRNEGAAAEDGFWAGRSTLSLKYWQQKFFTMGAID